MSGTMTSFFSKNQDDEDQDDQKLMTEDDIDEDIQEDLYGQEVPPQNEEYKNYEMDKKVYNERS